MMAMSPAISTTFLPNRPLSAFPPTRCQYRSKSSRGIGNFQKSFSFTVRAAKLPPGVEMPKVEPKLTAPSIGFTQTAEIWNSRACMIGLIGIFILELVSLLIKVHDLFHRSFPSNLGEIQTVLSSSPAVNTRLNTLGLIFHRGILQIIGIDVGKGLDLPL